MKTLLLLALLAPIQEDEAAHVRGTVLGLPGVDQKSTTPAPPVAPAVPAPPPSFMMGPRVKKTSDDYKELLDHNVFSAPRKREPKGDKTDGPKAPEGPKTRTWVLTGIVLNTKEGKYEALIEDPASKEGKYFKTGETVAGATISEVTFDQVTVVKGDATTVLKLKDTLTEQLTPGAAAPLKPEESAEMDKVRERMKNRHKRESVSGEAEEEAGERKKPKDK